MSSSDSPSSSATTRPDPTVPSSSSANGEVEPGGRVGRFVVLYRLGRGGMGTVWAAFDPRLDRKVALKLLHAGAGTGAGDLPGQLLREAQALARLSHPNVVAIHEVGEQRGQVYLALELVDGQTLKQWLSVRRRPWREVLRLLLQAGRGLAAAHAARMVHRDFKPANVLVGADGRVRVSDFGLARPVVAATLGDGDPAPGPDRPLMADVTEQGVVAGTRGYMSPEQARGAPVDARSDQFSFSVTAHEALCGVRPEALGGIGRRATSAAAHERAWPLAPGDRAPRSVLRVLARGLQEAPAARYPSMDALLRDLERAARPPRALMAAAVAMAVGVAGAALWRTSAVDRCSSGMEEIQGAWSEADRQALRGAFTAAGDPGGDASQRVIRHLDEYAQRWGAAYRDACDATRNRRVAPESVLASRVLCLEARRRDLKALVRVLRSADAALVGRAPEAVLALPGASGCANAEDLSARLPPPDDPALREELAALAERQAAVYALTAAGQYRLALEQSRPLLADAERLGYPPFHAQVLRRHADLLSRMGDGAQGDELLMRALVQAERGQDDLERARVASALLFRRGYDQGHFEDAYRWAEIALAILGRVQAPEVEAHVLYTLAVVLGIQGRTAEALDISRRLERLIADHFPAPQGGPLRTRMLAARADVLANAGRMEEAIASARESVAMASAIYGPAHPRTADMLYTLGRTLAMGGGGAEARQALDQAIAIWTERIGPDAKQILNSGDIKATAYQAEGRFEEALREARHTLSRKQRVFAPDDPNISYTLENIGYALVSLGRPAEAIPLLERAIGLRSRARVAEPDLAEARLWLAKALWSSGRDRKRALSLAARAELDSRESHVHVHRQAAAWLSARSPSP